MEKVRDFHLGDILSAATGRLLSPRGMEGIYDILGFMTGDSIYTHQIPRVIDECASYLLNEMPWIGEIDVDGVDEDNFKSWLNSQTEKYGRYHPVWPIHFDDHKHVDPVEEAREMFGHVIVIEGG